MSKQMATALNAPEEAETKPRKLPVIDPAWCTLNHDGQCWREFQIRLPQSATLVDLNETPSMWKQLQESRAALRMLDRVTVIAWDSSWMVEARVTDATKAVVTLAIIKRYDLIPRTDRLPQDDTYAVRWYGNGFAVERKSDKLCVSPVVATVQEAERALNSKYTRAG